jgi:hypothetical protein
LMYDHWSLREIWPQEFLLPFQDSVSQNRDHLLQISTQCSLLKSGSQLSRKSERLHRPSGNASAVCSTFEMTNVYLSTKYLNFSVYQLKHKT